MIVVRDTLVILYTVLWVVTKDLQYHYPPTPCLNTFLYLHSYNLMELIFHIVLLHILNNGEISFLLLIV